MYKSYQIHIYLKQKTKIVIGRLGTYIFPKGFYIYTGSAIRNFNSRIQRHLSNKKKMYWHIDYFLKSNNAKILKIKKSHIPECKLNKRIVGSIICNDFGSSDCKYYCYSHLKLIH